MTLLNYRIIERLTGNRLQGMWQRATPNATVLPDDDPLIAPAPTATHINAGTNNGAALNAALPNYCGNSLPVPPFTLTRRKMIGYGTAVSVWLLSAWLLHTPDGLAPGVTIDGQTYNVHTIEELRAQAVDATQKKLRRPREFRAGDVSLTLSLADLKVPSDPVTLTPLVSPAVARAWLVGREVGLARFAPSSTKRDFYTQAPEIPPEVVTRLRLEFKKKPKNNQNDPTRTGLSRPPYIAFEDGRLTPHPGYSVFDADTVPLRIAQALQNDSPTIELSHEVPPPPGAETIAVLAASAETWITTPHSESLNNMTLAAEALDGIIIPPGGILSFNEIVGERTEAMGYKISVVFENGRRSRGVGGGICQTSTTLYMLAQKVGLKVVERWHHSRPVPYAPPGGDATIAFGSKDLKLQNLYPYPVALHIYVTRSGHRKNMRAELWTPRTS